MKRASCYYIYLTAVLFFFNSLSAQAQTVGLLSHLSGSDDDGYVLFTPFQSDTTYLIDKCGRLVHMWGSTYHPGLDAYLLPDGSLLRAGHYPNPVFDQSTGSDGGIIQRFDWNGTLLWHYVICDSTQTQNHDIYPMPNGNFLAAIWEVIPDSVAIANGRNPSLLGSSNLWSAKIMEIQPIGTDSALIVWQWRLWDHLVQQFDATKLNYGVVANHPELLNLNYINTGAANATDPDWTHMNQVTYNPTLDQIMISGRNQDELWIIDHSTTTAQAASHSGGVHNKGGDFLYRWGNASAYGRGTVSDIKLYEQHDPTWITSGKFANQIMIFNNGLGRPGVDSSSEVTSIDIINPPVDASGNYTINPGIAYGPDTLSWRYEAAIPTNFYSPFMGSAQILPNGNTLICNAMIGIFFEIDSAKNTVWDYVNPVQLGHRLYQGATPTYDQTTVYRCTFYPSSYSAFNSRNLIPGSPIELNPSANICQLNTGISTLSQKENTIQIFPNPADNVVTFNTANLLSATLTDMMGKVVFSQKYENTRSGTLNVSSLAAGVYILCINDRHFQKLLIQH